MPKGSAELTRARREEIIAACRKLYETMSFKEITLKDIGQQTSFTRTSIYNYFETKEENTSFSSGIWTRSALKKRPSPRRSWPRPWPGRWRAVL